jgi:hypothetical protein
MGRGVKLGEFSRQAVERASHARNWMGKGGGEASFALIERLSGIFPGKYIVKTVKTEFSRNTGRRRGETESVVPILNFLSMPRCFLPPRARLP